MTRFTRRARAAVFVAGAVVCFTGFAPRVFAQEEQFRRGLDALQKKQWQAAAALMREAIQLRGQESTERVGSGLAGLFGGGREYLPHYFLGEALFNAGDCSGAVNAWVTSEQQGAIQKSRPEYLKTVRTGYVECEKKGVLPPGKLDAALKRTLDQIEEVNGYAKSVSSLGQSNLEVWQSGSNQERWDSASAELQAANQRYNAARSSRMQGDLNGAGEAVERARGILVTIESGLRTAIDSRRSAQALVRDATDAINLAEGLRVAVDSKKIPFTPAMTATQQEGRDLIGRARDRLAEGQKTLNVQTLNTARTSAVEAQSRFRQVLEDVTRVERENLQRQLSDALTRAADTFSLMDTDAATLERFSTERPNVLPPDKVAERDAVQRDVERARRRLDAARKSENLDAIAAAARSASELRDRLSVLIASFGPLTLRDRGVHAQLEEGAGLFLKGEYQQAVAALGDSENLASDVALQLHFHLFKAAALYELFLRSQGKDQALQAQALEEIRHCKAIDSAFQPNARAFSPRFVSFYQSVSAPVPAAAAAPAPADAAVPAAPVAPVAQQ